MDTFNSCIVGLLVFVQSSLLAGNSHFGFTYTVKQVIHFRRKTGHGVVQFLVGRLQFFNVCFGLSLESQQCFDVCLAGHEVSFHSVDVLLECVVTLLNQGGQFFFRSVQILLCLVDGGLLSFCSGSFSLFGKSFGLVTGNLSLFSSFLGFVDAGLQACLS